MYNFEVAFDLVQDEIKQHILTLHEQMKEAIDTGAYAKVSALGPIATKLKQHLDSIAAIEQDMLLLLSGQGTSGIPSDKQNDHDAALRAGRVARGLRTREEVYVPYILKALKQMGGRASFGQVQDRVGELMGDLLNEYDRQPLASDPKILRWRNAVAWARMQMIDQELLKSDSPKGIWELTEKGMQQADS